MALRMLHRIALAPIVLAVALTSTRAALANDAMPESKYAWSPDKGARTVGVVFIHVAAANYGVPSFIGIPAPAGFDFGTYEHSLTNKSDIVKSLKNSFAHMEAALKNMPDAEMDTRGAFFLLLSHAHEHLGQSIPYARSNKVTPPWTAKRNAADAKPSK